MDDPKRWLEGGDASETERALLGAGLDADPPAGEKEALWRAIEAKLVAGGGGAAGAGGSALATAGKIVGVVLVVGLGAGAIYSAVRPGARPAAVAPRAAVVVEASPVASAGDPPRPEPTRAEALGSGSVAADDPLARANPRASAKPTPRAAPTDAVDVDALREEAALVSKARETLRGGDPRGALALLDAARVRFPNGALVQERQMLAIEALAAAGDREGASRQAKAFVEKYPKSPLAARARAFL